MSQPLFEIDDQVQKCDGAYGGPGKVVGRFEVSLGIWRYCVAHAIEGGYGVFVHIYSGQQLRPHVPVSAAEARQ